MVSVRVPIVEARDAGVAVLLVSAELDEILSLSDRIAVIYHGQIAGIVDGDQADAGELGLMMAGGSLTPQPPSPRGKGV